MAKQYSINGFLYSINNYSLIEHYFRNRGITDFTYTKNTDKRRKKQDDVQVIKNIIEVMSKQSESVKQEIDRDFSDINTLSDDKGIGDLFAKAKDQNINIPLNVSSENNGYEMALWFFNNHKTIFNESNVVQEFFASGWKRVPVPNKSIELALKNKDTLSEALRTYYQNKDKGLGQRCLIDVYPKKDRVYVVAYVSARGENDVIPDEEDEKN